jgi:hypothetical protein
MTKIQIKRGIKSSLPILDTGEFALCTDTNELYVGSASGNMSLGIRYSEEMYYIDLKLWGISNDYTNPDATTVGINNAIKWAKANGYKGAYLTAGTYSIQTGYWAFPDTQTGGASIGLDKYPTQIRGIRMVSDFTFEMHPNCILKANPDSAHFQSGLVAYKVKNVTIKGGQLIGDRDTHNYVGYPGYSDDNVSPGYGGVGMGLYLESADNIKIYDTYISDWHGDGIILLGYLDYGFTKNVYMKNVTSNNNRRQGMSSISAYNLLFEDCTFSNTNGQDPEAGVDLEGGISNENVVFRRCNFLGNNTMGLIAYDCDVILEDCYTDQVIGISGAARHVESYNTTFNDGNYRNFFAKYPNLIIGGQAYEIGQRVRMGHPGREWYGSAGYVCTKSGTTSTDLSYLNKNNYPPNEGRGFGIQESQRGVTIVCGDSEWLREYYVYTYGGTGGLGGFTYDNMLPEVQRSNNTLYNVGDIVRLSNSNPISLKCTASTGNTGASEPSIGDIKIGETLIDGGITWQLIDNVEPVGIRQNNKPYNTNDYIWWDSKDGSIWKCVTQGNAGTFIPRLEDLALGAQIKPHYASTTMTKIAWNSSYPQWAAGTYLGTTTNINVGNTSWSCTVGNLGDRYPTIANVLNGTSVNDGTIVWKKVWDYLTAVRVEDCTFKNTGLVVGAHNIIAKNNSIINNQFTLNGRHVISQGNIVDNREKDTGINMSYIANSGTIRDDIFHNGVVLVSTLIDYRQPKKRIYERITSANGVLYGDAILYDCTMSVNRDLNASTIWGNNQMRMVGGNFSAYVLPNVKIFGAWHSTYEFLGVTFDIILSDTTGTFFNNLSRQTEGNYFVSFRDCTFRVLPQVYDAQLFNQSANNANLKLLHNRFLNLDSTKSIKIWVPTQDPTNTAVIDNYFDQGYYVQANGTGTFATGYNRGGYSLATSVQSSIVPIAGDYAVGTRITNSAPAVGSPKGWVVTTAGLAYQSSLRANSTSYNVGDWVKWSTGTNVYECIQAGISATTPPLAGFANVTDGGVIWLYRGSSSNTAVFTSEGNL